MIEILDCNGYATVQDLGRPGYRHLGVPLSGALDSGLLQIANALAQNPVSAAAIEMRLIGPRLRTRMPLIISLAGSVDGVIESTSGDRRPARAWASHRLLAGDTLKLGPVHSGVAYLGIAGGIDVPPVLGSRSTYERAHFGGFEGRRLAAGDRIEIVRAGQPERGEENSRRELRLPEPPLLKDRAIRVLAGPHSEHFTDKARSRLTSEEFVVSRQADRMGLRLEGPRLDHDPQLGSDIVSDAVTPGAIQVPGDGQPIVLLADCQTVGGYPVIATVISADLPRLGHAVPGQSLRFVEVDYRQAVVARCCAATELTDRIASIRANHAEFDSEALFAANLIDGVFDAQRAY